MSSLVDLVAGENDAVAIAVHPLLDLAERHQIDVGELRERFAKSLTTCGGA